MKRLFLLLMIITLSYAFIQSKNTLSISAGVAIFLFGMLSLEEGFRFFTGGLLDKFLKAFTNKVYKSIIFGAITTTLMQSSGLVAVIAISFISAGLIGLTQGIGIVLGANIGTTTGAWLIAGYGLKISLATYAMPMLVFGTMFIFQSNQKLKGFGYVLTGLGFAFLGIAYMKEGFDAFKESIDLTKYAVSGFRGTLIFVVIGIIATIIMQSSHASLVLILTALSASQITYENAIALTIGANMGTTITAIIGALGASIEGKKLAGAHFFINFTTGLLLIGLVPQSVQLIDITAPFLGIKSSDLALKIALYHTYFNVLCVALFSPLITLLSHLLDSILKKPILEESIMDDVLYINDLSLDFPDTAQAVLFKETKHLYSNVFEIIAKGLSITKEDIISGMEIDDIIKLRNKAIHIDMELFYENRIKMIYGKIINFAVMAQGKFAEDANLKLIPIKNANIKIIEAFKAAKHMQKNMMHYIESDNESIKDEYNHIRRSLIKLLRNMQLIFSANEEDIAVLLLSKLKLDIQKYDIAANKSLDNLIRTNKITFAMATSLMNDTTYAYTIATELAEVAHTLFVHEDTTLKEGREALLLNEQEVDEMANNPEKRSNA
ncbi:MAG: Na/Pi symporter [Sulfurospirillaceae bacterium]|nr:Na/Pi symporter [Sulfurospirillaceae bacterium]